MNGMQKMTAILTSQAEDFYPAEQALGPVSREMKGTD